MMYGYGDYGPIMGGGFGIICLLTWLVVFIDLVLVGVWLWQHITKK
jgi:hypothetical protein